VKMWRRQNFVSGEDGASPFQSFVVVTKYELRLDVQYRTKAELRLGLIIFFVRLHMTSYETLYLRYEV